ncbi:MAG: hypothetical protein PF505_13805, partial [Vallitaleaceae bacterium]|nr:hypothetical protein [Vallitaleaceae bacterium]
IQAVVSKDQLMSVVEKQVEKILFGNPTAYRVTKEIAFKLSEQALRNSFTIATGKLVEFLLADDTKEVLNANEENRPKVYTMK